MNIKTLISLFILNIIISLVSAQERYINEPFKISLDKPVGEWKETDQFEQFMEKIGGFEFTDNNLLQFMEENFKPGFGGKRGKGLVQYRSKEKHYPFLKLSVTLQECHDFEEFKDRVTNLKSYFDKGKVPKDLSFEVPPKTIEISGIRLVMFTFTATYKNKKDKIETRVMMHFIPMGEYYFRLTCNDYPGEIDLSKTYEKVIKSIKIGD